MSRERNFLSFYSLFISKWELSFGIIQIRVFLPTFVQPLKPFAVDINHWLNILSSSDLYAFAVPENAAVGTTVGRIMAGDADVGINARMTYSLEDDLEESSTFIIETDPVTQEGVVVLAKVSTQYTVRGKKFIHFVSFLLLKQVKYTNFFFHDWINTISYCYFAFKCGPCHVSLLQTLFSWPYFPPRTSCLFSSGKNLYFGVCVIRNTYKKSWVWTFLSKTTKCPFNI